MSDEKIASPLVTTPDSAAVMNNGYSLPLREGMIKPGSLLVINSSLAKEEPRRNGLKTVNIEATGLAERIGNVPVYPHECAGHTGGL